MDDDDLIRKLNSVGKTIFAQRFKLFKDYAVGNITKADAIEILVSDNVSNDAGAAIRCSNAVLIFRAEREFDALRLIADSGVDASIKEIAAALLDRE